MHRTTMLALAAGLGLAASAAARAPIEPPPRLLIRLHAGAPPGAGAVTLPSPAPSADRESAQALDATRRLAGDAVRLLRRTAAGALVVELPPGTDRAAAQATARTLPAREPAVATAEVDHFLRRHAAPAPAPHALPSDPYAAHQWPLPAADAERPGRADFLGAWQRTLGRDDVVVAILDSGTTHHPDTQGRENDGFDLVSDLALAVDGGARDADPSDPGDFCADGSLDSSWHGTRVGALVGAVAGNGYGIAGAAPGVRLQHLRVLGRCGAWSSDVADAIVWAAGGAVPGLPRNATPARVINLSLGASGVVCTASMQAAIDGALRLGAVVVASAGNDGHAQLDMPANCRGVLSVGAATESGDLALVSNHSSRLSLVAPAGGACRQQAERCIPFGVATSSNSGRTLPELPQEVSYFGGTSAAAPHVAAAAALALSAQPGLTPAEVSSALRASASRAWPADSYCAGGERCGAGMLDARAAVAAAEAPLLTIEAPADPVQPLQRVELRAALRVDGIALQPLAVEWTQLAGPPVTIDASAPSIAFSVPPMTVKQDLVFAARASLADGRSAADRAIVRTNLAPALALQRIDVGAGPLHASLGLPSIAGIGALLIDGPPGLQVIDGALSWPRPRPGTHRVVLRTSDGEFESSDQSLELRVERTPPTAIGGGAADSGLLLLAGFAALALGRRGAAYTRRAAERPPPP